ncbi:MAG: penicillin acylase family protein [Gammaproteobacteria bacterium]
MKRIRSTIIYLLLALTSLSLIGVVGVFFFLRLSVAPVDGDIEMPGLSAPVTISYDRHGIPLISAENRLDAITALGFSEARERLFQMDLMRRKSAGRLAELFGPVAADSDVRARILGFNRTAKTVVEKLPALHRRYLEAYAEGVNRFIAQAESLPFEFSVLRYSPEPWTPADSLLVALGMFDTLTSHSEFEERMLSVMNETLPEAVIAFLTPDSDPFTDRLTKYAESWRPARPIPVESLASLLSTAPDTLNTASAVQLLDTLPGSNAWAVGAAKTRDGRAILANDMHLGIGVPNIWYRVELRYGNVHAAGVTLPGIPILVSGGNERIAWGNTNQAGDFLDLVTLELNPDNPNEYRLDDRWQRFDIISEEIAIKGAPTKRIEAKSTVWGPVSPDPLLGKPVAVHWTALDAGAVDLDMLELETAESLEQALDIANRTGGPQLNFLVADNEGRIAWTILGKLPDRFGIDGSVSRSWADGNAGWRGYLSEAAMPRRIDPPEGILVSANDRHLMQGYPYMIGRKYTNGYRAFRITQRLEGLQQADEKSMLDVQLDAESEFYEFYRQTALSVLTPETIENNADLAEVRNSLLAWNGSADADSPGFAVVVKFRDRLAHAVFEPFLAACKQADTDFRYAWTYVDTPLQALLTQKPPQLAPDPVNYRDWDAFILAQLRQSIGDLETEYPDMALSELTWGQVNKAQFKHPFSRAFPMLGYLLDMPYDELSGCRFCVRVTGPGFGASERLAVSPGHLDQAILHMPGGQSGHPLSPYYRDQESYWLNGLPMPLLAGAAEHKWVLRPVRK